MNRPSTRARAVGWLAAALTVQIAAVQVAVAQQVQAASSGRIGGVAQNAGQSSIARATGGERVGSTSFAVSEGKARTVSGKVQGYGVQAVPGSLRESMFNGKSSGFGSQGDFGPSDFVGTMPGPRLGGSFAGLSTLPGSGFGISLSGGGGGGGKSALGTTRHGGAGVHAARPQMKDPDSILHPFTHSIGGGMGSTPGSMPTVLGAGSSH